MIYGAFQSELKQKELSSWLEERRCVRAESRRIAEVMRPVWIVVCHVGGGGGGRVCVSMYVMVTQLSLCQLWVG